MQMCEFLTISKNYIAIKFKYFLPQFQIRFSLLGIFFFMKLRTWHISMNVETWFHRNVVLRDRLGILDPCSFSEGETEWPLCPLLIWERRAANHTAAFWWPRKLGLIFRQGSRLTVQLLYGPVILWFLELEDVALSPKVILGQSLLFI